jgi:hypothetical protein
VKPKTLFDVKVQEATDFIKLPFFLVALEHSPLTKGFVNYDAFFMLLDKGLPLRFSEPGCCFDDEKIPNGDVKCALLRIGDALFETDIQPMKLFTHDIIKTEAGNDISLAGILIGREDVRRICASMGLNEYPWVKIPWPETASDFCDLPVGDNKSEQSSVLQESQKAAAEIKAGQSPGNKSIEDLLESSIAELLSEIRPENDYERYFYLYAWKREFETELLRVNTAPYADEARREDRISSIRSKIREIENYLDERQTQMQALTGIQYSTKNNGNNPNDTYHLKLTKLQKQQKAILAACELKKYDPLAIPDGGKGSLKMICEADHADLFDGDTSFDNAWKASKTIFRMANHASYSKRGKE